MSRSWFRFGFRDSVVMVRRCLRFNIQFTVYNLQFVNKGFAFIRTLFTVARDSLAALFLCFLYRIFLRHKSKLKWICSNLFILIQKSSTVIYVYTRYWD